ncbi:MAG: GNAT family N-acetyltransferase [Bacteroidales bacterium]
MKTNKKSNVIIISKPDFISWEEITQLLNSAFRQRAEKGMHYVAANQSVEDTIRRVDGDICLVALINNKLVGTVTLHIKNVQRNNKKWFYESSYGYLTQLAVNPQYMSSGIGRKLQNECIQLCYKNKVDAMFVDTSVHAKDLVDWYQRLGAQKVEYISYSKTNYYSVRFRTRVMGKKFNNTYVFFKYIVSKLICILTKTKNGDFTLLGRVAERFMSTSKKV